MLFSAVLRTHAPRHWQGELYGMLTRWWEQDVIKVAFDKSVDDNFKFLLDSRQETADSRQQAVEEQAADSRQLSGPR
jgi:hypothetical protein